MGPEGTAATPRVKKERGHRRERREALKGEGATLFRRGATLVASLAQGWVEIAEAMKCQARCISRPREANLVLLKRLIRLLSGNRRCCLLFLERVEDSPLRVHVGSDSNGDLVGSGRDRATRWSLAEAHVADICVFRRACTLGVQSYVQDCGIDADLKRFHNARVASSRGGLVSNLRHVQTRHLEQQERVVKGHLTVPCVRGMKTIADALTSALPQWQMRMLCDALGQCWQARGAAAALEHEGQEGCSDRRPSSACICVHACVHQHMPCRIQGLS